MYLSYGVNEDGEMVYIDQVARGRTALCCPYCGIALVARKGQKLTPHFAHDGKTCYQTRRAEEVISLPAYSSFRLNLSARAWTALQTFYFSNGKDNLDYLERLGLVKPCYTRYGIKCYELTHKGSIPFGHLSLNLFNQFQEPLIYARHDELSHRARLALGQPNEVTLLTDLRLYRAQIRRILETKLYFIEVHTDKGVLHKIGVTSRPLKQRLNEIQQDLIPHFNKVELSPLGTWDHRGNVEPYFKYRYRRYQRLIGNLTEYFTFEDVKPILRDLRRMQPKTLNKLENDILVGKLSHAEARELRSDEILSKRAWNVLCNPTKDNLDRDRKTWYELHNFHWEGQHHRLIETVPSVPEYTPRRSIFGEAYYIAFTPFYERIYPD